jgi:hypothetical protein
MAKARTRRCSKHHVHTHKVLKGRSRTRRRVGASKRRRRDRMGRFV